MERATEIYKIRDDYLCQNVLSYRNNPDLPLMYWHTEDRYQTFILAYGNILPEIKSHLDSCEQEA